MILRSSPPSPFGRKVKIAAALLGIEFKVEPTDTNDPADPIRQQNPIGKIPTLVLDDGTTLFDSRVILEYLDHVAGGGRIIPQEPKARFAALRMQALADGLLDAALMRVYEGRWRSPEQHVAKWVEHQAGKITRTLDVLEAEPPGLDAMPHVGQITVACALGYLDLRFAGEWRKDYPKLVKWLDAFAAKVPSFEKTRVTA
jgi:glutathione S-transferase